MVTIRPFFWTAPCRCFIIMLYDRDRRESTFEDKWDDPEWFHGVAESYTMPDGSVRRTTLCAAHESVGAGRSRDVCWRECKKVSAALRNLVAEVPAVIETVQTPSGELTRYRDGVLPIEYPDDSMWSGPADDRIPTIRLNRNFRRGIVTAANMRNVRARVQQDMGQGSVEVSEEV